MLPHCRARMLPAARRPREEGARAARGVSGDGHARQGVVQLPACHDHYSDSQPFVNGARFCQNNDGRYPHSDHFDADPARHSERSEQFRETGTEGEGVMLQAPVSANMLAAMEETRGRADSQGVGV